MVRVHRDLASTAAASESTPDWECMLARRQDRSGGETKRASSSCSTLEPCDPRGFRSCDRRSARLERSTRLGYGSSRSPLSPTFVPILSLRVRICGVVIRTSQPRFGQGRGVESGGMVGSGTWVSGSFRAIHEGGDSVGAYLPYLWVTLFPPNVLAKTVVEPRSRAIATRWEWLAFRARQPRLDQDRQDRVFLSCSAWRCRPLPWVKAFDG